MTTVGDQGFQRTFASYLLLPRPQEIVVKTSFVVVAYVTGRWASPARGLAVPVVVAAVFALEFLAYQARYMINDLLDAGHDAEHPSGPARRRLPEGNSPGARPVVLASVATRLVAAAALALVLPGRARLTTLAAVAAVFLIAAPYETLRRMLRRPVPQWDAAEADGVCVAVFVLVGAGYALRTATGIALAGAPWWSLVLAGLFAWPFGVAFVTMTWALEATAFVAPDWGSLDPRLSRKRHLGALLRRAGLVPLPATALPTAPIDTKVLLPRSPWGAPWMLAALVSAIGAAFLASALASGWHLRDLGSWCIPALAAISVSGTVAALRSPTSVQRFAPVVLTLASFALVVAVQAVAKSRRRGRQPGDPPDRAVNGVAD